MDNESDSVLANLELIVIKIDYFVFRLGQKYIFLAQIN